MEIIKLKWNKVGEDLCAYEVGKHLYTIKVSSALQTAVLIDVPEDKIIQAASIRKQTPKEVTLGSIIGGMVLMAEELYDKGYIPNVE